MKNSKLTYLAFKKFREDKDYFQLINKVDQEDKSLTFHLIVNKRDIPYQDLITIANLINDGADMTKKIVSKIKQIQNKKFVRC